MGQAKQRGTFEQRKAEAIAAGREKIPKKEYDLQLTNLDLYSLAMGGFLRMFARKKR